MTLNTVQTKKFDDEVSYADDQPAGTATGPVAPSIVTDTATAPDVGKIKAPRARRPRNLGVNAGEVDAEGAARAKADEVAAVSIGLSPKPPVYENLKREIDKLKAGKTTKLYKMSETHYRLPGTV